MDRIATTPTSAPAGAARRTARAKAGRSLKAPQADGGRAGRPVKPRARAKPAGPQRRRRVRLDPEARAAMILDEAVAFFAEHGFQAQIRDLADRLGVSQALIFRYFGTKGNLIERVYERVYVARWSSKWQRVLSDATRPLEERLIVFYKSYLAAVDQYEWIRTSLFSGLAGYDLTRRYILTRVESLLKVMTRELRRADSRSVFPRSPGAMRELVWHLHSTFIYYLVRKHVFLVPVIEDRDLLVESVVRHFMTPLRDSAETGSAQPRSGTRIGNPT